MITERLAQAIEYRQAQLFDEAHAILIDLYTAHPLNPQVNYQLAWLHDAQGKEREAVPFYVAAIQNGLMGDDLKGALLGLGSTYRCIGAYDKAIDTLRNGMKQFPDAGQFPVFLAMALYNVGQHAEAMALLLRTLAHTSMDAGIQRYQNAILFYHDKLDERWD